MGRHGPGVRALRWCRWLLDHLHRRVEAKSANWEVKNEKVREAAVSRDDI